MATTFWIGGYGGDLGGDASGIGVLSGDDGREPVTLVHGGDAAAAPSPSWLAAHPSRDVVYAALEGQGAVQAYIRSGDAALSPLGDPVDAGELVCHLAVAPDGGFLVASCYGDGRVVRIPLAADGRLGTAEVAPPADDPYAVEGIDDAAASDRASHAHAAAFLPDGRIATTDLGFDQVRIWRAGATGLVADSRVVLPRGVGPRHMVVHPSGHLHVVTEHSCEVFTLAVARDGTWSIVAVTTVSPGVLVGANAPAELSRSKDGTTLYAGIRGSDAVAALRVRGAGDIVEPLALAESGVAWPRHHLVHDGALLVAGQLSGEISVLDLDDRTGAPGRVRHRTAAPSPTHLVLAR
ncbi:lactonase family protein [Microbacterium pseudoresistens]|uniref:6-phosphogluconolactonase (Cycloisomerase 2 family) n=1 Tax=Microbacterium pseudoresistens TaxID=640634 RepID=A0A7Y9EU85_9MICO|nr:beta-propeller fold lactonase family protein [Microbacterium pseudoresistens]NYD53936.1 6-phosphogluconolactonase (cycloisomerase 2 family) [Microbacterium pseudoresistens]